MIILFSASEAKKSGGKSGKMTFTFGDLDIREPLLDVYQEELLSSEARAKKITGWKNFERIDQLPKDIWTAPVMPAIERFTGVGFQYLDFGSLENDVQDYLEKHLIIFSHLFGPLLSTDQIPETKLKQCQKFGGKKLDVHFREELGQQVEDFVTGQPILDLRASVYVPYFKPNGEVIQPKFLKDGKVVNHWSKAYRGVLAREVAIHQPKTIEDLKKISIKGMTLKSHEKNGKTHILVYEIMT